MVCLLGSRKRRGVIVKRMFLVLTVALVMVAMIVATAVPAFADRRHPTNPGQACEGHGNAGGLGHVPSSVEFPFFCG